MESAARTHMTLDLLVCPGCRTLSGERLDVRTLDRAGDLLGCECGRRYPIVDDVPIVMRDASAFIRKDIATIIERDLAPEVAAQLVADGPDDAAYPRMLEHLSIYLDAHWGDRVQPPAAFALAPFVERIAGLPRVGLAVELGCSVGRLLAELPAERAVGIDMHFGAIRRARHLLAGESIAYARREIGRNYSHAVAAGKRTAERKLVCADALDPPLLPDVFDRVIALNMIDSVAHPRQLLSVIDGLCKPGGEIIVSSPYSWQSSVMHEHERLGGADPAAAIRAIFAAGDHLRARYRIEDEAEIAWTLRRDARSDITYRTHYLRARKGT
jgi:SAM-dependent methyltransferase/uncharacterized protein YbaR (Trm112 family)